MINLTIVTTEGCHTCKEVKQLLEKIKNNYPLVVEEVDATTEKGKELAQQYNITSAPGIIINEELFKTGSVTEEELKSKLDSLK